MLKKIEFVPEISSPITDFCGSSGANPSWFSKSYYSWWRKRVLFSLMVTAANVVYEKEVSRMMVCVLCTIPLIRLSYWWAHDELCYLLQSRLILIVRQWCEFTFVCCELSACCTDWKLTIFDILCCISFSFLFASYSTRFSCRPECPLRFCHRNI